MRDSFVLLVIALFLIYLGASRRGKMLYLVLTGQEDKIPLMVGNYSSAAGYGGGLSSGGGAAPGGSGGSAG